MSYDDDDAGGGESAVAACSDFMGGLAARDYSDSRQPVSCELSGLE